MRKILIVFGTRPEAIKLAPVILELRKHPNDFQSKVCVTAQHREMLDQVLELFSIKPHYEHSTIGYNYRMSNILAAIGRGQLRVLDDRVKKKREIFDYYQNVLGDLPGIEFMPEPEWSRSNRWLTVILITPEEFGADRETVRLELDAENIEARPVWKPMHLQPVFKNARCVGGKVAEDLFKRGLCLPSGTAMTEEDLNRVVSVIHRCCKR